MLQIQEKQVWDHTQDNSTSIIIDEIQKEHDRTMVFYTIKIGEKEIYSADYMYDLNLTLSKDYRCRGVLYNTPQNALEPRGEEKKRVGVGETWSLSI